MQCSNCGHDLPAGVRFCPKCGTPIATSTASPATAAISPQPTVSFGAQPVPQPLSGGGMTGQRKKSGCGKALVILLVIGLLLIALAGGGAYYAYRVLGDKLRASEAYTVAVAALKSDPVVAEKMGTINDTGFPLGAFHEEMNGTGDAAYHLSVKGTKANGTYDVAMTRRGGKWYLLTGKVKLANGEMINIKSNGTPYGAPANTNGDGGDDAPPPPASQPPPGTRATVVSGGVLNGKVTSKPDVVYPQIAKAAKASGTVTVQVAVDEQGKVTAAHAVSGHPLLRPAAESAARQTRLSPTLLSGRPVKVTGVLTYNFELPQ